MNKKLIVANWKMNFSHNQACSWLEKEMPSLLDFQDQLVICPSYTVLPYARALYPSLKLGAQDCGLKETGPFTGDVSVLSYVDLAIQYCIIGHSERRTVYGETNSRIAQKAKLLLDHGITPLICVGEKAYEKQKKEIVLTQQLEAILPLYKNSTAVIAYEPHWAIGTGQIPTLEELNESIEIIRSVSSSQSLLILYGGSVTPEQVSLMTSIVDGFLIGSASLDGQLLKKIIISC